MKREEADAHWRAFISANSSSRLLLNSRKGGRIKWVYSAFFTRRIFGQDQWNLHIHDRKENLQVCSKEFRMGERKMDVSDAQGSQRTCGVNANLHMTQHKSAFHVTANKRASTCGRITRLCRWQEEAHIRCLGRRMITWWIVKQSDRRIFALTGLVNWIPLHAHSWASPFTHTLYACIRSYT